MDLDAWTKSGTDPLRRGRLLLGYAVGVVAVVALSSFVAASSGRAATREDEDPAIEAQLVTEPEPEPEPVAPPAPKAEAPKPPPPKPKIKQPTEVPQEPLKEAEADKSALAQQEDPFQREQAVVEEPKPAEPAVVEAPPPPAPKPIVKAEKKGPIRVTEEVTPPVARSGNAKPEYPSSAKASGIEGVVVVKYVVTERGEVTDVKVIKGPPELHDVCIASVKGWRFEPAILDGQPVAVVRVVRFPFKIKT